MIKMRKEAITFEIFNKILFGLYRNVNEKILNRFYIKCNLNQIIFNCIQKKKKQNKTSANVTQNINCNCRC